MAELHRTAASLRISGDDLDPEAVSQTLHCQPTEGFRKGQVVRSASTGKEYTKKTGAWMLDAEDQSPGNLDAQVRSLLDRLPADLSVWQSLASRFKLDLFCGFFMQETDEGLEVSADTLRRLGERSISLGVCIYAPLSNENDEKEGLLF